MRKYFLKINKKLGQAINTLTKVEKLSFEELVTEKLSDRYIVVHFGLGTEDDYLGLRRFLLDEFGVEEANFSLDLYPGYPHGFLAFKGLEISERLNNFIHDIHVKNYTQQLIKREEKKLAKGKEILPEENSLMENRGWLTHSAELSFSDRPRLCFFFNTLLKPEDMKCFSAQENSLQPATTDYNSLLKFGLVLVENVLSEAEEAAVVSKVYEGDWENLSHRRVQHYGYKFIYSANSIDKNKPIREMPKWATSVLRNQKLNEFFALIGENPKKLLNSNEISTSEVINKSLENSNTQLEEKITENEISETQNKVLGNQTSDLKMESFADYFDQLTINEYQPGSGIPPHTDSHAPFEEPLISVSLLSDIVMLFRNPETGAEINLLVPKRSALILTGESRYLWTHAISSRKIDRINEGLLFRRKRISLTFRKSKVVPFCDCSFAKYCDFVLDKKSVKISEEINLKDKSLEKKYVKDVYNSIAEHFSHTRYKAWPRVEAFLRSLPKGSLVGDLGCGNGKYMFCVDHLIFFGTDIAENFALICKQKDKKCQLVVADTLSLPFKDNSLDHAISIAVIHHLSTPDRRKKAVKELMRVVRPGGKLLIYVWAFEQHIKKFESQDVFVPWNNQLKYEGKSSEIGEVDKQLNEVKKTVVYKRYYHVFKKGELEELVHESQNELGALFEIKDSYYDHENWCVELLKK